MIESSLPLFFTVFAGVIGGMFLCLFFPKTAIANKETLGLTIIGVGAEKLSGKSTMASYFEEKGFVELAFAGYLKRKTARHFKISAGYLHIQSLKERTWDELKIKPDYDGLEDFISEAIYSYHLAKNTLPTLSSRYRQTREVLWLAQEILRDKKPNSPRELLQILGTEVLRDLISEDFHTAILQSQLIERSKRGATDFFISDMRFKNERDFVSGLGGIKVRMFNTKLDQSNEGHGSENSLGHVNEYDYVFYNHMDADSLHRMDAFADSFSQQNGHIDETKRMCAK